MEPKMPIQNDTQKAPSKFKRLPMILTGQALMSLRDSGFSLPTALAEVVDNSLEARANKIDIRLDESERRGKKFVHRIVISDDGEGMDNDLLHHYLQIGFSTRYMQKDTIGKYGVGAKLAALNFGKRIEVWSRAVKDSGWSYVSFDLDKAVQEEKETGVFGGIEPPRKVNLPNDISEMAAKGTGTIVAWSEVDRLEDGRIADSFDALRISLEQELSRIFREFMDSGINIRVNGRNLLAHDPLFLMSGTWADKVLSKVYSDPSNPKKGDIHRFTASVIADEFIKVKGSQARLRVTLYPPEVTRRPGKGGDSLAKQLRVPENEGCISFMRLNREIAYTNVPRIFGSKVQRHDRHIGIEVSFKPELDDFFGVRNVKRGVEPQGELRQKLGISLKKYVGQARKMLEERWGQVARDDHDHEGEHAPILDAVKEVDKTMPKGRAKGVPTDQVERELGDLATDVGYADKEKEKEEYLARIRSLPFVVESVDFPGKMFIDIKHLNNQVIIRLNTRHRFYQELWAPLSDIARRDVGTVSGGDAVKAARRAVEGLALMLVAYGKAQSMDNDPAQYDDLTSYWGQFVDTLMGKVKDVT